MSQTAKASDAGRPGLNGCTYGNTRTMRPLYPGIMPCASVAELAPTAPEWCANCDGWPSETCADGIKAIAVAPCWPQQLDLHFFLR